MNTVGGFDWKSILPYALKKEGDPEAIREWIRQKKQLATWGQWISGGFSLPVVAIWWFDPQAFVWNNQHWFRGPGYAIQVTGVIVLFAGGIILLAAI